MALGLQRGSQVLQQRRLLLIAGAEAAGAGDLVEAEPGAPRRLRVLGDAVGVATVLGDREGDPLAGGERQHAAAQLRAHAGVGAQHRGSSGEDADEL
jgi:hypothetical protein